MSNPSTPLNPVQAWRQAVQSALAIAIGSTFVFKTSLRDNHQSNEPYFLRDGKVLELTAAITAIDDDSAFPDEEALPWYQARLPGETEEITAGGEEMFTCTPEVDRLLQVVDSGFAASRVLGAVGPADLEESHPQLLEAFGHLQKAMATPSLTEAHGIIEDLLSQIDQMKGMFDDSDGAIAQSIQDAESFIARSSP